MAVERDLHRVFIDQLVYPLVEREIIRHQEPVSERHVRELPLAVNILPVDRPHLDDAVGVFSRKRERGAVQVNNHPGDGRVDVCLDTIPEIEDRSGCRVTVIAEILCGEEDPPADFTRHLETAVRDRD